MMSSLSKISKELSPFGQSALRLDQDFAELERLSGEIEHVSIDSDKGLQRARQLLARFSECGQRIAEGVQGLASTMEQVRARAEKAAQSAASRAALVQERQAESERMLGRFHELSERVRGVGASLAQFKKDESLSEAQKFALMQQMSVAKGQLDELVGQTRVLKDDARLSRMRELERNADAMGQSLDAARRRLEAVAPLSLN